MGRFLRRAFFAAGGPRYLIDRLLRSMLLGRCSVENAIGVGRQHPSLLTTPSPGRQIIYSERMLFFASSRIGPKVSTDMHIAQIAIFHFRILAGGTSIYRFLENQKFREKLPPLLRLWRPHVFLNIHLSSGNDGAQEESPIRKKQDLQSPNKRFLRGLIWAANARMCRFCGWQR